MEMKQSKYNKNFTSNLQQNVVINVKRLDIYGGNICSEKECLNRLKIIWNIEDAILQLLWRYLQKEVVVVDLNVTILKQNLDNSKQQNRYLQKGNYDLRIYLERLEKNYKRMKEQFYELNEEKEELSQFENDSDLDMNS